MKKADSKLLSYIYSEAEVPAAQLLSLVSNVHNDHRDFYGLASLIQGGYIGFTGPVTDDNWKMAKTLQCYRQGKEHPEYENLMLIRAANVSDSSFYIASQGVLYFYEQSVRRRERLIISTISLFAAILSGSVIALLKNYLSAGVL